MFKFLASLLAAIGIGAQSAPGELPAGPKVTSDLRSMVFALEADKIGISPATYPHKVWGVVMETGMDSGYYTLVTLADGSTSLYFSTGGGVIGAGEHDSVRKAGQSLLGSADRWLESAHPAGSFPPPAIGQTNFYFLTFDGKFVYSAQEVELGEGRDKLSDCFHAAQAVITAIRETGT